MEGSNLLHYFVHTSEKDLASEIAEPGVIYNNTAVHWHNLYPGFTISPEIHDEQKKDLS